MKSSREIGRELKIYHTDDAVGKGLPLFTPRGTAIRQALIRFTEDEEDRRGYQRVSTPIMAKSDLYEISGHWNHYKDGMFTMEVGDQTYALRPMSCPFHFLLYNAEPRSYRELPIRYAEIADLFRNEQSGELSGLSRVRQFTLADSHIITTPEELETEFNGVLDLINFSMEKMGIGDVWYRFSKRDPADTKKYVNDPQAWEETQETMRKILENAGIPFIEVEGEAAFYGPKLDLQVNNIHGKEETLITVQTDFALPKRFRMVYEGADGKKHTPRVIHRSSVGCIERTMSHILEQTQGNLPTWMSPVQIGVLNIGDEQLAMANEVVNQLRQAGVRAEADVRNEKLGYKIREQAKMKTPYVGVVGKAELENGTVSVRQRGSRKSTPASIDRLVEIIKEEQDL